jgi:S-(hydroxymethyl)glutathione dehydrogenase / alcohol dehydrogenase
MTRAVVLEGATGEVAVQEIEVQSPRQGEVRAQVVASGICHSDLHTIDRGGAGKLLPIVLGHEAAGVVLEVGDGVSGLEAGDHIIFAVFPQCGECKFCSHGQPTLCVLGQTTRLGTQPDGTSRYSRGATPVGQYAGIGAWSEQTVVSERAAVKVDPDVPLRTAALIGCGVATGYGAVANVGHLRPGETMAVLGCGGVGLHAIQAGRITGAGQIIAIDLNREKLQFAQTAGATHVLDSVSRDPVERVRELTDGAGVDLALDFVGTRKTAQAALAMSRRGGTAVITGLAEENFCFPVDDLVRAGRTVRGNYMGMGEFRDSFRRLIQLYKEGDLVIDQFVSRTVKMDDFRTGLDVLRRGAAARVVIEVS